MSHIEMLLKKKNKNKKQKRTGLCGEGAEGTSGHPGPRCRRQGGQHGSTVPERPGEATHRAPSHRRIFSISTKIPSRGGMLASNNLNQRYFEMLTESKAKHANNGFINHSWWGHHKKPFKDHFNKEHACDIVVQITHKCRWDKTVGLG